MDSNRRKQASEWFYHVLYRDEQIRPRQEINRESVPEEICSMRALESGVEACRQPRETIFVKQARLMESYEDNFCYDRDVVRYFPTYQSLTDRELRGYFTWRSAWRRGERKKTNLSFAFLYIYELLNQIGVKDPVDGFEQLRAFEREYGVLDDGICSYLHTWLWDYVIVYRLDPVLLADRQEVLFDRNLSILMEAETRSDAEILEAVLALSSYRLDRSKLFVKEPEMVQAVTAGVIRAVSSHYCKHRKQSMTDDYFGPQTICPVEMFRAAVFDSSPLRESFEYRVDPLRYYQCRNGRWSVNEPNAPVGRSKKLGDLIRTVDSMLREVCGTFNPIQPGLTTKWIVRLIAGGIDCFVRNKQAEEARKIQIDYSKLSGIRADALVTQGKLIVDGEQEVPEETDVGMVAYIQKAEMPDSGLNSEEHRLLQCLLFDRSISWVQEEGFLLSVLVDGINEKLYERFDDTVLFMDAGPELIEDYVDDLKEMLQT